MKRELAFKMAKTISERIRSVNGLLGTPDAGRPAVRIKRAWVFGSTVKGKECPNDLDVLLDLDAVGDYNSRNSRLEKSRSIWAGFPIDAEREAHKYLRSGLKMVRFHHVRIDGTFGDIQSTKVLIYPRFDLGGLKND